MAENFEEKKKELIKKLINIRTMQKKSDGSIMTVDDRRKALDDLGVSYEIFGIEEKRKLNWSPNQQAIFITELLTTGWIEDEREINNALKVTFKSQTAEVQEKINNMLEGWINEDDNKKSLNQKFEAFNVRLVLAACVKKINDVVLKDSIEENLKFWNSKDVQLITIIYEEFFKFQMDIRSLLSEGAEKEESGEGKLLKK